MSGGRFHKIRGLRVSGGFLDGLDVAFDPRLNCIIGGRGSGKTTVLEFLRFALKAMPDADRSSGQRKQILKLLQGNLQTGRITVEVETKDGLVYFVERSLSEEPEVLDDQRRPTKLSLDHGSIFSVEVYSQNEIESIANRPSFQLDLIDTFIESEVREINQRLRALGRELGANGNEIVRLTGEIEELSEGLSELDVIAEKLKAFQSEGGQEADAFNQEVAARGLRDREGRVVQALLDHLGARREALGGIGHRLRREGEGIIPDEVHAGANRELFERIAEVFSTCTEDVARLLADAAARIDDAVGKIDTARADLGERHREQEERYRELLAQHEKEEGKARERMQLQRRQNELQEQKRRLDTCKRELRERTEQRTALLRELFDRRSDRTALREKVAADLTEKLTPDIRVTITQHGDKTAYRELLNQAFRGSGKQYGRLIDAIVSRMPPHDFARQVMGARLEDLVDQLDVDSDRASWLIQHLRGTTTIYNVEAVELNDVPRIELKDGPDYKDSSQLSTGQKCTTILPILLLESEKPLLIDQPEDNLDNAFIYDTIVRKLRDLKKHRQLIFVTHNPNIPVLCDAGQVVVLTSSGRQGAVEASGTVDDVKGHVATILEGGQEAFTQRRKRYGY